MKIRVVFLLFVFGALAVLAEEGKSEKELNSGEKPESGQNLSSEEKSDSEGKPSSEEKKDEKEDESSKENEKKGPKGFGKAQKALKNIDRRIQSLLTRGDGYFHWMLETAGERKINFKKRLEGKFQTLEFTLKAQQENEIRKAVNNGKDGIKIQECFDQQKFDLKNEMKEDIDDTFECFDYATIEAKQTLDDSRDRFLEVTKERIKNIRKKVEILKTCLKKSDGSCVQETIDLRQTFNKTVDLADFFKKNGEKALEEQKKKMVTCRKKFLDSMGEVGDAYFTLIAGCTSA